jgi:hypothetical protein
VDINLEIRCQGWAAARVEILRADFIPSVQVLTSRSLYFLFDASCIAVAGQLRSLEDDVRSAYATEELSYCCLHVHMRVGLLVEIAVVREGLTYRML